MRLQLNSLLALLFLCLCVSACSELDPEDKPTAVLTIDTVPCPSSVSTGQCGTVVVPLDYRQPHGEKIKVGFVQFKATKPNPDKLAIHFFEGGPGGATTDSAAQAEPTVTFFRERFPERDLLIIDPRGAGLSGNLGCKIIDPTEAGVVNPTNVSGCSDTVGDKAVHYTSTNTARDFSAVVKALGYKKLDIVGYSYGTFLGSIYASLYPEHVRTLSLDGAYPTVSEPPLQTNFYAAVKRLFNDLCARSNSCAGDQASSALTTVTAALRQNPRQITVPGLGGVGQRTVTLDPSLLAGIAAIPPIIDVDDQGESVVFASAIGAVLQASNGRWGELEELAIQAYTPVPKELLEVNTEALFWSITCNDNYVPWERNDSPQVKLNKLASLEASAPSTSLLPFTAKEWSRRVSPQNYLIGCAAWRPTQPNPLEDPARASLTWPADLPVAVFNGDLDLSTPTEGARRAAAQFRDSRLIISRGSGHVITPASTCAAETLVEFVNTKTVVNPNRCLNADDKKVTLASPPPPPKP
jgi:pimeloyl-ACP methyl ester carboxylesterase